jgi:hypothetical protein
MKGTCSVKKNWGFCVCDVFAKQKKEKRSDTPYLCMCMYVHKYICYWGPPSRDRAACGRSA